MGAYSFSADDASTFVKRLLELADVQPPPYYHDGNVIVPPEFDAVAAQLVASGVHASKPELLAYAAMRRWEKEVGGVTVSGVAVATDDRSKQMILGARIAAVADGTFTTQWVGSDGSIVSLNATQIIAISNAVLAHVQACFSTFATVEAAVNATPPTITARAAIDTAFAAIT